MLVPSPKWLDSGNNAWQLAAATFVGLQSIPGLAVGLATPINGDTQQNETPTAITCTNPVSGTSWQITIDFRKATVDSNPAEIKRAAISWFDPKDGGNYTLDRKSGDLTASVASSTGGYFRHNRCDLDKSR